MARWVCEHPDCDQKVMDHRGVPRHRQMHHDRHDGPFTMRNAKWRFTYDYREEKG